MTHEELKADHARLVSNPSVSASARWTGYGTSGWSTRAGKSNGGEHMAKMSGAERAARAALASAGVQAIIDLRAEVATLRARLAELEAENARLLEECARREVREETGLEVAGAPDAAPRKAVSQ